MTETGVAVPEEVAPPAEQETLKMTLYLNSGHQLDALVTDAIGTEPEEVASKLFEALHNQGRPGWMQFGNLVAFSGAVGAIEIDTA